MVPRFRQSSKEKWQQKLRVFEVGNFIGSEGRRARPALRANRERACNRCCFSRLARSASLDTSHVGAGNIIYESRQVSAKTLRARSRSFDSFRRRYHRHSALSARAWQGGRCARVHLRHYARIACITSGVHDDALRPVARLLDWGILNRAFRSIRSAARALHFLRVRLARQTKLSSINRRQPLNTLVACSTKGNFQPYIRGLLQNDR